MVRRWFAKTGHAFLIPVENLVSPTRLTTPNARNDHDEETTHAPTTATTYSEVENQSSGPSPT